MNIPMSTLLFLICAAGLPANDLATNPAGVSWLDTNDDWGRTWGDAANHFYKSLKVQREHLAGQGVPADRIAFAVGSTHTLAKVFRPKVWFRGDMSGKVAIAAARGEYEGFQLVVCPVADAERELTDLSAERAQGEGSLQPASVAVSGIDVSPLQHAGGAYRIGAEHIRLYRVDYITTVPPQYPVMHVGRWPDPLVPLAPFEVSNPYCQPVWVEVHVPRDAPAGAYRGQVVVHGAHDVRLDVSLTVWDFDLPDPPQRISNGWSLHAWFGRDGIDMLLERLEVLLEHRLIAWHTAYEHHENLADHDRVMELLLARGVQLQATSGKPSAAYVEHLRDKGWLKHFVCIWGDEPHERDYPTYRQRGDEIRREFPGLAVAMTEEPTPSNVGLFDVWIAEPSAQHDDWVAAALARGDRVWWYLCQLPIHASYPGPIHRAPGMVVDRPAIDHRITYWLAFRQGIEGVSYWAVSHWPAGWESWPGAPWPPNPRVPFPYSGQHNANGFLCYPGSDGLPWPSIRLKCMRDGLEDQDYLSILRDRRQGRETGRGLDPIPARLAMGLRYYNKDPNILLALRRQVAEEIVRLGGR